LSRLLRPEEVPAATAGFNLVDFEHQAEELLRRAKGRAAEMLDAARKQAESVIEEAREAGRQAGREEGLKTGSEEGRQAGHQEGVAAAREATATLAETLGGIVAELSARRAALVKEAERDLLGLAVGIASRIVRRELAVDGGAVARAVAEAAGLAAERTALTVRVNPADLDALRAAQPELTAKFAELEDAALVGDDAIERGGCRLVTADGEVDMQVATQIERIERLLVGEAGEAGEGEPPAPADDGGGEGEVGA